MGAWSLRPLTTRKVLNLFFMWLFLSMVSDLPWDHKVGDAFMSPDLRPAQNLVKMREPPSSSPAGKSPNTAKRNDSNKYIQLVHWMLGKCQSPVILVQGGSVQGLPLFLLWATMQGQLGDSAAFPGQRLETSNQTWP